MKCPNCGYDNMDGSNFCSNCGTKLEAKPEMAVQADPVVEEDLTAAEIIDELKSSNEEINRQAAEDEAIKEQILSEELAALNPVQEEVTDVQKEQAVEDAFEEAAIEEVVPVTENAADFQSEAAETPAADTAAAAPFVLVEETVEEPVEEVKEPEKPSWYYVYERQSHGPVTEAELRNLLDRGLLDESSFIWTPGMKDWIRVRESIFAGHVEPEPKADDQIPYFKPEDEQPQNTGGPAASTQWFYVQNSRSTGPFNTEVMAQLIANGSIGAETYVWKEGMSDWDLLKNTALAVYLPVQQTQTYHPNGSSNMALAAGVPTRSIILYILLSILTCGIWELVWLYQLAADVNRLAEAQNKPKGTDPVLTLILVLISCSLYQIFFFWKDGTVIGHLEYPHYKPDNQAVLLTILSIFLPIASMAILQDQINTIVKYGK